MASYAINREFESHPRNQNNRDIVVEIVFAVTETFNPKSFSSDKERRLKCIELFGEDINFTEEINIGTIYFNSNGNEVFSYNCKSGGWGKGPAPYGHYEIRELKTPDQIASLPGNGEAYAQFGFGWAAVLTPLFDTDRTGLWYHCDGNVAGSLGCPVSKFDNINDNTRCWNLIRDAFEKNHRIPFRIESRQHA